MTFRNYYTYGIKTTAQINALTNLKEGESVWNSDLSKPEYVVNSDGSLLWVNEDCVVLINNQGSAVTEGDIVKMDYTASTSGAWTKLCTNVTTSPTDDPWFMCGIVFRGGANGSKIVVAQQGIYNVKYRNAGAGTVSTRGNLVTFSGTAGQANQLAPTTGITTLGTIGVCMITLTNAQLVANNYLVKIMIQSYTSTF
jgi:hypothetical protein